MAKKRNIIVGQSGGPTAVINSSLAGVYKTAKERGFLYNGIIRQLFDGIHGIVSADIDKRLDLQFIQYLEYLFVYLRILVNVRQLIPTGAQECRRCSLQQFDIHVGVNLRGQVHILLIQKSLNGTLIISERPVWMLSGNSHI